MGWLMARVDIFKLLESCEQISAPPEDRREVAIIEGVCVLFHEHRNAVKDEVDGVSPGPFADEGPADNTDNESCLPNLGEEVELIL